MKLSAYLLTHDVLDSRLLCHVFGDAGVLKGGDQVVPQHVGIK